MNIITVSKAEYRGLSSSGPGQQSLSFAAQRVRSGAVSCLYRQLYASHDHQLEVLPAQSILTRRNLARRQETTLDQRETRDCAV